MQRGINILNLVTFAVLGIIIFLQYRQINSMKEDLAKELIRTQEQRQLEINGIRNDMKIYALRLDSLQMMKDKYVRENDSIQKRLRAYKAPRYFVDATFSSESKRIAESSYRHTQANDSTGSQ